MDATRQELPGYCFKYVVFCGKFLDQNQISESEKLCFQDLLHINKGNPKINADQHTKSGEEQQDTLSRFDENEIEHPCNLSKQVIPESTRKLICKKKRWKDIKATNFLKLVEQSLPSIPKSLEKKNNLLTLIFPKKLVLIQERKRKRKKLHSCSKQSILQTIFHSGNTLYRVSNAESY